MRSSHLLHCSAPPVELSGQMGAACYVGRRYARRCEDRGQYKDLCLKCVVE